MAIDKLGLYNGALRKCRRKKLASLSENRRPRRLLDDVWAEDPVKFCLEQGQWQFATKTVLIEASTSVEPDFGFKYAFEKPDDYVRTVAISANEYFTEGYNDFADETDYLFAPIDTLYVKYVSDAADYGRDYSLWPISFQRLVIAHMAQEIVGDLTDSTTLEDKIEKEYEKRMKNAKGIDGVQRPTRFPPRGAWVRSRRGRRSYYDGERP